MNDPVLPRHLQYHELSTRQYVSPTTHGVFSNRDNKGLQIDFRPARVFKQHLSILLGFMQIGGWCEGLHLVLTEA